MVEANPIISVISALAIIAKSVNEWRKGRKKKDLRLFFNEHIEPVYRQMGRIHKDYIDGFGGLLKRMRDGELPPRALYDWFEEKRRELESERVDARNFQEEFNTSGFYKTEIGSETAQALSEFVKAVTDYFLAPDSLYKLSFYSDFSLTLRSYTQVTKEHKKMSKLFYDTDFVRDFYEAVERAVNIYLPKKWKQLSYSYHRVKGLLLK